MSAEFSVNFVSINTHSLSCCFSRGDNYTHCCTLFLLLPVLSTLFDAFLKRLKNKGRFFELFNTAAIFGLLYSYSQQVPAFTSRGATHHTDARDLYQRRWELLQMNFASKFVIYGNLLGSFTCRKAGTWDRFFYFTLRRKAYWGFSGLLKNPANSGSSGQYAKHYTTEAVFDALLGAFPNFLEANIIFVISVRLYACPCWTNRPSLNRFSWNLTLIYNFFSEI